jgi:hypothetical protein
VVTVRPARRQPERHVFAQHVDAGGLPASLRVVDAEATRASTVFLKSASLSEPILRSYPRGLLSLPRARPTLIVGHQA